VHQHRGIAQGGFVTDEKNENRPQFAGDHAQQLDRQGIRTLGVSNIMTIGSSAPSPRASRAQHPLSAANRVVCRRPYYLWPAMSTIYLRQVCNRFRVERLDSSPSCVQARVAVQR